eukprot:SAG31_NODE_8009_length_1542_cov_2.248094_2_plen_129_part_00
MAAAAIGVGASAAATALGLGLDGKSLEQTHTLFKLQMRQSKRLWAADWAESAWRHGESMQQAAQQHAEAQAIAAATFVQAERFQAESIRQVRPAVSLSAVTVCDQRDNGRLVVCRNGLRPTGRALHIA